MKQPALRPQDIVILAKLASSKGKRPAIAQLGSDLFLAPSEVHSGLKRLAASRLIVNESTDCRPLLGPAEEFLLHGLKYVFPARRGEITRGMPTSHAGPPLNSLLPQSDELPPVWPFAEGALRGPALLPLYPSVPAAAGRDPILYELLVLIDAIRDGRVRERQLAERELTSRLRKLLDA